jgi:hypothetical protein
MPVRHDPNAQPFPERGVSSRSSASIARTVCSHGNLLKNACRPGLLIAYRPFARKTSATNQICVPLVFGREKQSRNVQNARIANVYWKNACVAASCKDSYKRRNALSQVSTTA